MTKQERQEQQTKQIEAVDYLRTLIKPGDTITTTVLHVNPAGVTRCIMLQIVDTRGEKPEILEITHRVARAIGKKVHERHGGVVMHGCGMDMRFETVYQLGQALFPDGFVTRLEFVNEAKENSDPERFVTLSPRASKVEVDNLLEDGYKPVGRKVASGRGDAWDNDGGYALGYRG